MQSNPESRLVLAAIASFSSGSPPAGVYRWLRTSEHAAIAASTMCCGVGKSGSPAPNPITFSPSACRALALASTARVADGAIAASRSEVRFTIGKPATAIPRSQRGSGPVSRVFRVVGYFEHPRPARNTRRHELPDSLDSVGRNRRWQRGEPRAMLWDRDHRRRHRHHDPHRPAPRRRTIRVRAVEGS